MPIRGLQDFWRRYKRTNASYRDEPPEWEVFSLDGVLEFLAKYGGVTFDFGLYRLHTSGTSHLWSDMCWKLLGLPRGEILCFGYDWTGSQFFLHQTAGSGSQSVLLLEPETGEAFRISQGFVDFHEEELVRNDSLLLSRSSFFDWFSTQSEPLRLDECVGTRIPLCLGGSDVMSNRQRGDMRVYWELQIQILNQVEGITAL